MQPDPTELVCQELVELVTEYLSHTLPVADRVRFEHHLLTCPPCTSYLAQIRSTIALAGELDSPPATGDVGRELVSLFRRWHQK